MQERKDPRRERAILMQRARDARVALEKGLQSPTLTLDTRSLYEQKIAELDAFLEPKPSSVSQPTTPSLNASSERAVEQAQARRQAPTREVVARSVQPLERVVAVRRPDGLRSQDVEDVDRESQLLGYFFLAHKAALRTGSSMRDVARKDMTGIANFARSFLHSIGEPDRPVEIAHEVNVTTARGELVYDMDMGQIMKTPNLPKGHPPIDLTKIERGIFEELLRFAGRPVPYHMIVLAAWGGYYRNIEGDYDRYANLLKTHVCHLREKLGEGLGRPISKSIIGNLPTRGYILRASPKKKEPLEEETSSLDRRDQGDTSGDGRRLKIERSGNIFNSGGRYSQFSEDLANLDI